MLLDIYGVEVPNLLEGEIRIDELQSGILAIQGYWASPLQKKPQFLQLHKILV